MNPRGTLRIFFSYTEGTGRTRAMLRAAQEERHRGRRVALGCAKACLAPSARALCEGLDSLAPQGDAAAFDLDRALDSGMQLIVLGELARDNAEGSRHAHRFQDAQELLRAGMDVYATLTLGQLEGSREAAAAGPWIPDAVFDAADQVEYVDREPEDWLRARASRTASSGASALPAREQLDRLRQAALLRCADRLRAGSGAGGAAERILVCLSPAPSNARVIRMAMSMANAFRCRCTALFVRNPGAEPLQSRDQERLASNMKLAGELGAQLETVTGEDVAFQIAEYARLSGTTKVVLGRSVAARGRLGGKHSIADRLIRLAPGIEIHILPDGEPRAFPDGRLSPLRGERATAGKLAKSAAILLLATALSLAFFELNLGEANIIMAYILGVVITAVATSNRLCSILSSIGSVFIFNYLFTEPRFSLNAYDAGYPVTFLVMLTVALIAGTLAAQLKSHARESARTVYRTRVLLETNQQLSQAAGRDGILDATATQLVKLFQRGVSVYPAQQGRLESPSLYPAPESGPSAEAAREDEVAEWVFQNNRQAGATTDTFPQAQGLYLAIRSRNTVYGVVGLSMGRQDMKASEHDMLLALLGECALALENERNLREKEAAAMQARSEQLRANLLRAISHDLRTPLTAICGNASNLMTNGSGLDEATRSQIYTDIHDDALWLINLVENLLYVTRLEDGRMKLRCSAELIDEVLQEALRHETCRGKDHDVSLRRTDELLLAHIDARLIIQVIVNLVDNALKYTPAGSHIELSAFRRGGWIVVRCADDGPGVAPEDRAHIFEMFYSGKKRRADSRRSLGLGLGLCSAIVSAHGGTISVHDNEPRGAVFEFTVPAEEVNLNE